MNRYLSKYFLYYPTTLLRGELIARHLDNANQFQWKDPKEIHQYQLEKLNVLLNYAYNNTPYYQKKLSPDICNLLSLNLISTLPFLRKSDLIQHATTLASKQKMRISTKTTGGSTGQAVTLLKNADALARERAVTWRSYRWANIEIGDPQARFWGVPLQKNRRLLYAIADIVANRIRLSAFNMNEEALLNYHKALHRFSPTYLYGYVSMIHEFSRFLKQKNLRLPSSVQSIITTSEVLTDSVRHDIESNTDLRVFNEYGCGEVGSIAHECEHGNMHLMSDNLIIEIVDQDNKPSDNGEIIVTDLFNYAMPLIRYKLGDFASTSSKHCPCGRNLPIIEKIHGRAYDIIVTPHGNRVHPESLMYVFEEFKENTGGIDQFQVIQTKIDELVINIVASPDLYKPQICEDILIKRINQTLNDTFKYHFNYVKNISREKSGKLRIIKSDLAKSHSLS